VLPYDCDDCWDKGKFVDYRNGRGGRITLCTCKAASS
jgi:hypothetical protein